MNDNEIVELYLSRNEEAINQTALKYGARLRKIAFRILDDYDTAEECENSAYFETWESIPPHEPREYLYPFLARITRHISLNCCRDRSRLKRSSSTMAAIPSTAARMISTTAQGSACFAV